MIEKRWENYHDGDYGDANDDYAVDEYFKAGLFKVN